MSEIMPELTRSDSRGSCQQAPNLEKFPEDEQVKPKPNKRYLDFFCLEIAYISRVMPLNVSGSGTYGMEYRVVYSTEQLTVLM